MHQFTKQHNKKH